MSTNLNKMPSEQPSSTTDAITATTIEETQQPSLPQPNHRTPKSKDGPRRPLSAYNLFFRSERKRICGDIQSGKIPADYLRFEEKALEKVKGKGSKAHFQAIACTIAARWKELSKADRVEYEKMAESETAAYIERKHEYHRALVRECAAAARLSSTSERAGTEMHSSERSDMVKRRSKDHHESCGITVPSFSSATNITKETLLGSLREGYQELAAASMALPRMMDARQSILTGESMETNTLLAQAPAPFFTTTGSLMSVNGPSPYDNHHDQLMWQSRSAPDNQLAAQRLSQQKARYLMQQYENDMISSRLRILQGQLRLQEQQAERERLMALMNFDHRNHEPRMAQEMWSAPGRTRVGNVDVRYQDLSVLDAMLLAQSNTRK